MKFAVLAMVKNESDIIESFVRHNLQFADEMFILDNGSTDNTLLILEHLRDEGLPIKIYQDSSIGHRQQQISTTLLNNIQNITDADIFMFLDADEFICIHPKASIDILPEQRKYFFKSELEKVKQHGNYALKWLNFIPKNSSQPDYINHFNEFSECDQSLIIHQKVIFARDILKDIVLTQGNHSLINRHTQEPYTQMVFDSIAIAHFPIRSVEQAISKVLTTALSIETRKIKQGESFHIFKMKEAIINNGYTLSNHNFCELARTYGIPLYYQGEITLGQGKINTQPIIHKYLNLNNLNTVHNLTVLSEQFIKKIKSLESFLQEKELVINKKNQEIQNFIYDLEQKQNTQNQLTIQNSQLRHQLVQSINQYKKYKKLVIIRLLKPLIKTEQGLHSLNRYRKAFRILMREKGSFGKAYQTVRKFYKENGFKETKKFLKDYLSNQSLMTQSLVSKTQIFNLNKPLIILTTQHTHYVAKLIYQSLKKINIQSHILFEKDINNNSYADNWHIVICPQIFKTLPAHYIAFQMEQSVSSRWFDDDYFNRLNNAKYIFDYSLKNIEFLQANGVPFSNLFYLPIGMLQDNPDTQESNSEFEYDVAFYGDPNCERRQLFLSQLKENFSVKVISEVFGDELYDLLKKCKIIVNIHYYENALLETTRLYECLHLNKVVVSEKASDQDEHSDLEHLIDFVEIDDVGAMVDKIKTLLANPTYINERMRAIKKHKAQTDKFQFYFYRFLLAHDLLEFDKFYDLVADYVKPKGDFWCLSLPESTQRRADFNKDNHHNVWVFDGLRHHIGWIGCGLSYKFMLKLADQLKLPYVAICEDDVLFYDDFDKRYHNIKSDLANNPDEWDIFSGLIADLSKDIKLSHTPISSEQESYYQINKLVSMVFNIYNHSIYRKLWQWDYHHRNTSNTIDRYLENSGNIKGIITDKFLVGHKEELSSTLWGFQNTQYSTMIAESQTLLTQKINDLNNKENQ